MNIHYESVNYNYPHCSYIHRLIKGGCCGNMSNILLIRHGESQSNVGLPTECPTSVELTPLGIEQAICIADYLESRVPPDLIVTSSYERTKQTAEPTMSRFPFVPKDQWLVHEFTYLSSEEFLTPTTVEDRKPLVDAYWELCDPGSVDGPGSESFEQFIKRVRGVMKRFEEVDRNETVVIFSHEQFICAVYWLLERNPTHISSETMRDFRDFLTEHSIPNGGFLRLQPGDDQHCLRPALMVPLLAAV
jgi:2,3-bisphosphoglycerate-dependent phosphoglycerate mutase